jgi:hypothetical protein
MKTSQQAFKGILTTCGSLLIAAAISACVNAPAAGATGVRKDVPLSYEAFKAQAFGETFHGKPTGIFIVDGDTPADGEERLQQYYENYLSSYNASQAHPASNMIIGTSAGIDRIWNATEKLQLTYCISNEFALNKPQVVQAMAEATQTWTSAANIRYTYLPDEDINCTVTNINVLFDIQFTSGQSYLARSFFPKDTRGSRSIMIDATAFSTGNPLTVSGILRHELGHTLGMRHEHTRPEAGVCFEDNSWRQMTTYDSGSVMHYPQCNGTGDWSLTLSNLDKFGIASTNGNPLP